MLDFEKCFSLMERIDPQYRQYKKTINEMLLLEGDSRLKAVSRIIEQSFSSHMDVNGVVSGSEYYVNGNPNTTWKEYLLFNLRHTFGLMQNSDIKYLPVVARLAYSNEVRFDITNDNGQQIRTLQRIVQLLKKDNSLFEEVKNNTNITFGQLAERFNETFSQEDAEDAKAANNVRTGRSDYTVKLVPDFETAAYYGNYSCSESKLCYTQNESTWKGYTGDGINNVYVCLRNGWESIPEKPTEGNPYDLYGTSMIFVFISPDGNIATSNCRWNHKTVGDYDGDVDQAFTKATLSQTIGMPFDEVFKPKEVDLKELIENGMLPETEGDFVIPDGVTRIGNSVFLNCKGLTSITIPNSVTSIGNHAFSNCESLISINIPNSVTSIGKLAFYNCKSLTSIKIPNSVTSIGFGAFSSCESLTSITIPNSVTSIDFGVFSSCKSLTSIKIPNSVTSIGFGAFSSCESLTSITIPNSVTSIDFGVFSSCKSLTSITIPNSVTSIDNCAFSNCESLTSITIPNSVTSIGNGAFEGCNNLTISSKSSYVLQLVRESGFDGQIYRDLR